MRALRLLPIVIIAAGLMLSVRLGDIWFGLQDLEALDLGVNVALAAGDPPAEEHGDESHGEADDGHGDDHGDDHGEAAHGAAGGDDEFIVEDLTLEEIAVLQELAERRAALEQRESELNLREGLLDAAEQRIEVRITEMQSLRDEINGLIRVYDDQEQAELQKLVKIYETMKPKDAARILQDMELGVLLSIMESMKERSSAPILASMNPQTARDVTAELARRRAISPPAG